ncbi:MAG: DegT/DnrJ/EryC1/StrS family aminotransferase [Planctomycetes bacterium]|nr:DegT/DnrJ/EryC1/StrS family aminotransferase [Planctomycetota bacterium]
MARSESEADLPVVAGGRPLRDSFLVYGAPAIEEPEIQEVLATLRSGWIGTGPRVGRFQEAFRSYIGAPRAVAVSSCTAALHLSLLVSGVRPGDEVLVPTLTFAATANAVVHAGARPVLVDVDRRTQCMDPSAAASAVTPRTRAMVPVHFAGRPCDMDALLGLARRHGLVVIEDAAHAIEAMHDGRRVGTLGDAACFSFYVTKNVVTGEGGMVTTSHPDWADRIQVLALHGLSADAWMRYSDAGFRHYQVQQAGFKYNMTDLQAALGIHQLARVESNLRRREAIWARYDEGLAGLPAWTPAPPPEGGRHARHLYNLHLDLERLRATRDQVLDALIQERIGTGVHYVALHLHPYYAETFGYGRGQFPEAEWVSERTLTLPLSARLSDRDVEDVLGATRRVLAHFRR